MKILILLNLLFTLSFSYAQIVNIPDTNFKDALLNHTPTIDTNADGEIQVLEAEAITNSIIVNSKDISDLTGIEAFINITGLDCSFNNLTSLDCLPLSHLTYLECRFNDITNLSFPSTIIHLFCLGNKLESLDVSNHTSLYELFCGFNPNLININVNGCTSLYQLNFEHLVDLTNIDLSNTPNIRHLEIPQNGLTSLNISHLPYLMSLYCGSNQLETIDLSNNPNLGILTVEFNNLIELDISNNLLIWDLWFTSNNISSINLSEHNYIERLRCSGNDLTYLDIRNGNNINIYSFDAQNNPNLTCIYVDDSEYSADNWTYIDENSTFVETEIECDALSVIEINEIEYITIYPNPFTDCIVLDFNDNKTFNKICIYDSLGKLVKESKRLEIKTKDLSNGIYFVRVEFENGNSLTKKIIKVGA